MNTYYEETSEHKNSSIDNKTVESKEKLYNEDNYVFINEKYREYFDNISDIFEEKIDYILKKHFKKNEPTDKNKLLCLNVCITWRKTFLQLLSRILHEYDVYRKENCEKKRNIKEDELVVNENISEIEDMLGKIGNNKDDIKKDKNIFNEHNNDNDLKSYIRNVKVVDNKNIEVIYDDNDIFNDSRPSAELSTDEIYYLLVESKKSENEFKKKIYTFLKYLPLFIRSIENKNLMEMKILEEKLLLNSTCNDNVLVHGYNTDNLNSHENNFNVNTSNTRLSVHEIKNKLDTIVNFNCNLSENLENVFKRGINFVDSQNGRKFCPSNFESLHISDGEMRKHNKFREDTNSGQKSGQHEGTHAAPVEDVNACGGAGTGAVASGGGNENFNNMEDNSKNFFNLKNNKSLILPLSRVNDLSLINNISTKSINEVKEENKENETSFYIYKSNMNELNVYGLDILINVNNTLKNKINHIYSLIQFYTMLAQDVFNES
ncbi:hypothetical protein POVWA2_012870 [Plasmodium ovale wallikeri]|uniref:Uncharacterized protein n=2 Tax=Plasmodium ovale TaxID=36330 RepID=A0A1A8YNB0_PLAOA|nr:hypothetical protein POVWA1_012180 [Plasmodium ovale wallikeri]SBT33076.1 hypothetical protein POVWA2_012870 [Plasmodium ovale wallikeri]SBT75977.1 conserved Plasmodium protein, unknown function [Plasmodium ovale]